MSHEGVFQPGSDWKDFHRSAADEPVELTILKFGLKLIVSYNSITLIRPTNDLSLSSIRGYSTVLDDGIHSCDEQIR
jgi:hypothetical protein